MTKIHTEDKINGLAENAFKLGCGDSHKELLELDYERKSEFAFSHYGKEFRYGWYQAVPGEIMFPAKSETILYEIVRSE